jgi:hypothetical protein
MELTIAQLEELIAKTRQEERGHLAQMNQSQASANACAGAIQAYQRILDLAKADAKQPDNQSG